MPLTQNIRSLGGIAKALKIREVYASNPNLCKHCSRPILPVEGKLLTSTRDQKFCNRSCAARHNNLGHVAPKRIAKKWFCKMCNAQVASRRSFCLDCFADLRNFAAKKKCEVPRSLIAEHARRVMKNSGKNKACELCEYAVHVEVCHLNPVSSFTSDVVVSQINDLANLVYLCANHHLELDKGLLSEELKEVLYQSSV